MRADDGPTGADEQQMGAPEPVTHSLVRRGRLQRMSRLIEAVERGIDAAGRALAQTNDLDGGW
jgi:hypothetical protein